MSSLNEQYKYFSMSIFFLVLSKVVSLTFRLGSRVIIARFSSTDVYGVFSVIWNEANLISIILLIGLGQQLTIRIPRQDKERRTSLITSSGLYAIIISLLSGLLSLIFFLVAKDSSYVYSFFISMAFLVFLLMQFLFIGLMDFFGFFLLTLIQNFIFALIVVILRNNLSVSLLIIYLFVSIIVANVFCVIYLVKKNGLKISKDIFRSSKIFSFDKKRIYLFSVDIVNSLINYLMLKLAQVIIGSSLSAYINVAFSILTFVLIFPQMITTSIGPRMSENYAKNDKKGLTDTFRIGLSLIFLLQGAVILLFAYFGNDFILLLYGHEYFLDSFPIFYIFLLCAILQSLTFPFGFYIRNTDKESIFAFGKMSSLIVFIISQLMFLYWYKDKGIGVAIAYFASLVLLVGFYFYYILKLNDRLVFKDIRKIFLWLSFILISVGGIFALNTIVSVVSWKIGIFIAHALVFFTFLVVLKIINVSSVYKEIKQLLLKRKSASENVIQIK